MPQGLPRKIRIAFIMQVVLASVAILVGAYLISAVAKFSPVSYTHLDVYKRQHIFRSVRSVASGLNT